MTISRTALALLLTMIAVALPTGTWWVAGGRQLVREIELERANTMSHAYKKGHKLAEQLGRRLGALLAAEAHRPFYHYQNLYHDPKGVHEGVSVSVSPLAHGSDNPFVLSHFQVTDGRLTVPSLNDQFPELGLPNDPAQCLLLHQLEDIVYFCGDGALDAGDACPTALDAAAAGSEYQVEWLEERAWRQHLEANAVYHDLKYGRSDPRDEQGRRVGRGKGKKVRVLVGALHWRTVPVDGQPGLVALRNVETPKGTWVQGFVVSLPAVDDYLQDGYYPVRFIPIEPEWKERDEAWAPRPGEPLVAVADTPWGLALDVSDALAALAAEAVQARGRFLRLVLICGLAAAFAGLMVVALMHQSERLANQRAQFAASAAHELRTPLAGLRLYSEMLAEGLGDPSRGERYARRLAAEAERLSRVVTNVLSFTRLERKTLTVDPRPGDLAAAVRDVFQRNRPALEEAGAAVELEAPADLPAVAFDRDAVQHIVQNLLDNAEKYTRGIEARRIRVALDKTAKAVVLSVADNGRGISRSLRRKLFRPFARGENNGNAEGLGLGLVLVKALASAQGGAIRYSDAPAGGAVFSVSFPV